MVETSNKNCDKTRNKNSKQDMFFGYVELLVFFFFSFWGNEQQIDYLNDGSAY